MAKRRNPTPADVAIGKRVRARRFHLGISQATLGANLGVSYQQIQKYERGQDRLSSGRLSQIAGIVRTDANTLLATGSALVHPTAVVERFNHSGEGAALARRSPCLTRRAARPWSILQKHWQNEGSKDRLQ